MSTSHWKWSSSSNVNTGGGSNTTLVVAPLVEHWRFNGGTTGSGSKVLAQALVQPAVAETLHYWANKHLLFCHSIRYHLDF